MIDSAICHRKCSKVIVEANLALSPSSNLFIQVLIKRHKQKTTILKSHPSCSLGRNKRGQSKNKILHKPNSTWLDFPEYHRQVSLFTSSNEETTDRLVLFPMKIMEPMQLG